MEYRELSDDVIEATDSTPREVVSLLEKFASGECWRSSYACAANPTDTRAMVNYVERLKKEGLDIGGGDCEFGCRMPLPDKKATMRYLEIYRR